MPATLAGFARIGGLIRMSRRSLNLIVILVIMAVAIWVNLPNNPGIRLGETYRQLKTVLGLDLQGGMQVLMEADLPANSTVDPQSLQDARQILENRANGLGVSEVTFQVAGSSRIVGEFPGVTNLEEILPTLQQAGLLEFVDMGSNPLPDGTIIQTDFGQTAQTDQAAPEATLAAGTTATAEAPPTEQIYHTVMTGADLASVGVTTDQLGGYVVQFDLKPQAKDTFADFTSKNIGKVLAIVLDKAVISTPVIENAITQGGGIITGNFTAESANALAIQLRYGSLPVPLKVVESRVIGPTLGQDSLNKSLVAGLIGFAIVTLFMILYYRLPGIVAILALVNYALITLALFKIIPVTLTLPGIAGFLLSTGGALDANILIFERLKEELRSGRSVAQAIDIGWKRAWPSIRDSNAATIITSAILFWFGSAYGATVVKGFALTLALGVVVSLLSAIFVTRTFLSTAVDLTKPSNLARWFGI